MDNFSVDAYTPKQIADRLQKVAVSKSTVDPSRVLALSLLAGAFIAFGAMLFTLVSYDSNAIAGGVLRLISGLAFCLGLILVVVAGAELFTGNNLIVMAYVDGLISTRQLLSNWLLVYCGNFVGALGIVILIYFSGHWLLADAAVGARAVQIAEAKVNLSWIEAFVRGVLCNILVCMAVWLCFAGRSVTDKVLAVLFPITAFVALGFEHSVANMYLIPAGMLAQHSTGVAASELLTVHGFLWGNLLPVTLGNLLGGSVFVGLFYWFIYLRK